MREGAGGADPLELLEEVREAMELAAGFAEGMSLEEFEGDARTAFAVERALQIVGEAAERVPREVRERHPGLPWKRMAGMRDRFVHGYARADRAIVHRTATELIPAFLPELSRVIEEERRAARPIAGSEPGDGRKEDEDR
ncbi:MAG: DUF86 domain-containing protein [Actinomycetota bacterium]